jgi:hypothetical protein
MRSTKASAAVERLKARSGNPAYSMQRRSDGMFSLVLVTGAGASEPVGLPLPIDEFVRFVNGVGPQQVKRVSKLDVAFERQLVKKPL